MGASGVRVIAREKRWGVARVRVAGAEGGKGEGREGRGEEQKEEAEGDKAGEGEKRRG